jgi:hypothetical protein
VPTFALHSPSLALRRASSLAFGHRLAVWLSGLALLSLLLAPGALLAQDLQTGKLGGICSAGAPAAQQVDEDPTPFHAHCPLCSASWGLPLALAEGSPAHVAPQCLVIAVAAADPAVRVTGLPFSRGPPAL